MNGADVSPTPDEAFELIVSVAGGARRDVSDIASVLAGWPGEAHDGR